MLKKLTFFLFITFLLMQCGLFTTALPASSADLDPKEQSDHNTIDEELSARNKLLIFTLDEFNLLSNFTVEQGSKIFRNILNDMSISKKNSELEARFAKLSNFTESVEQLKVKSDEVMQMKLYDKVIEYTDIVESFIKTGTNNVTTEDSLLENLLRKHGFEQMELDFLERFEVFAQKFYKEAETYMLTLSEKEKLNEAEMIAWYEKFKNENGEKKIELFAKFFDFYKE